MGIKNCFHCRFEDNEKRPMSMTDEDAWDDACKCRVNVYECGHCGYIIKFRSESDI